MSWQSTATLANLQERAKFLQDIRHFFAARAVMEVDTPLLCQHTVSDVHLASFNIGDRYLQTSPEYAMKRLLAQGCGPIYYLGKAFREAELGQRHNPEFTMLEWYRPNWDHLQLMEEVFELLQVLLGIQSISVTTYGEIFAKYFNICPHQVTIETLQQLAISHQWVDKRLLPEMDKDGWLDLLMSHGIEPSLGLSQPQMIIDFPASQASLAKTRYMPGHDFEVAERFELYYHGVELANGYHELENAMVLRERFKENNQKRQKLGLPVIAMDENLLGAMQVGFGPCAGVALGVDRLLMFKLQETDIAKVLPFGWQAA
ncbi:MAG: EF-P lysine aminoacylase GenX [Proteobacteria bacterium]|nr:EF-P lysine aminoacylase GenX [Pseudomonadota bacterium]